MRIGIKKNNNTFIKYFLSYFILLTVMFIGFYIAINVQLKNEYYKNLHKQNISDLEYLSDMLDSRLKEINQINLLIQQNTNIVLSRYSNNNYANYLASKELKNHILGNFIINDIIYLDRNKKTSISSNKYIKYQNNAFHIFLDDEFIEMPIESWYSDNKNNIIFIQHEDSNLILYVPNVSSNNYAIIYVLNEYEIRKLLRSAISPNITSICLVDENGSIITGVNVNNFHLLLPFMDYNKEGSYDLENNLISYVMPPLSNNLRLIALSNKETLINTIEVALKNTYLILIGIGLMGYAFIILVMQITYRPLHKLTQKITNQNNSKLGYLEQISNAFESTIEEKKQLQSKINNYRMTMQKSILDALILDNSLTPKDDMAIIDRFFTYDNTNCIFVVKILLKNTLSPLDIKQYIIESLPQESACIVLDSSKEYAIYLINYISMEDHKEEVLNMLFKDYYIESNCKAAISNTSMNPLDIPSLYENALLACKFWNSLPVVSYNEIADIITQENDVSYPYKKLDTLTKDLGELDFYQANISLNELFNIIDLETNTDFFVRCILIDVLTLIVNLMNRANIKFNKFDEIYFETLYFCRSCQYNDSKENIKANFRKLLSIFQEEINSSTIQMAHVKQFIKEHYLDSEFSITLLSDHFNVSIAYMSYLFKKKENENFSDYVWNLRLEKAKKLLSTTDLAIDEISTKVGYLNSSSFRRKFKQATNLTPSQFRMKNS